MKIPAPLCRGRVPYWALLCLLLAPAALYAQVSIKIANLAPTETVTGIPVTITADLVQGETVERAFIVYRPFGESEYSRADMDIVGNTAAITLPAKVVQPPFLEYYIVLLNRNGMLETYPVSESPDPFSVPPQNTLRMLVRNANESDTQVIFLSPEPMSNVAPDEVLISFSLLRADSMVVRRATQLVVDGADVTEKVLFSGDIAVYAPDALVPGTHKATVRLYGRDGNLYRSATLTFSVRRPSQIMYSEAAPPPGIRYGGNVYAESRHELVNTVGTWYNRGGYKFSGQSGDWRFVSNAFVTSDEQPDRQPQNRFFAGVESPWLRVGYGDSYPQFPDLILSGKRVRGLSSGIRLGAFNLDMALGTTVRDIEGRLVKSFPADSFSVEFAKDSTAAYDRINDQTMGKFNYGTYARDLFIIRPSFGSGRTWQLGFTWMKSKDDVGSIHYGARPQENLVLGTDFVARLDNQRIEFSGQGAFSAYNSDISSGTFTDAYIDSVFSKDRGTLKEVRDILSKFITVNDNLRPLSLKKMSTLSYDFGVALNYFDNTLKFAYLFRGSDYTSFGQSFLRKDIKGFNIQDRLRLLSNQLFLTLGYERLQDNTSETKIATTTYSNVNVAVSYRARGDVPSVTVGFASFVNNNDLPTTGATALNAVDDATNRFFLQSSYDFVFGAQHSATFNLSTSKRDDRSARDADVKNTSVGIGINTRFAFPLQTGIDLAFNFNTLPTAPLQPGRSLDYTSLSLNARYGLIPELVNVTAAVTPTFGDFRRTTLDSGVEWHALPSMSLLFQFSFYGNEGFPNDNVASLRCRYDL